MLKLTETSLLVLSDFKRINQGLPVLCRLQTTYHSYTNPYWLRMPTCFPCVYSHSVLNPVMLWKKAYFSLATCIQYILHTTLDTVSLWLGTCAPESVIFIVVVKFFPVYTCLWLQHSTEFLLLFCKTLLLTEEMMFSCHGLLWVRGPSKTASKPFAWLNSHSYCWAISKAQSAYLNR